MHCSIHTFVVIIFSLGLLNLVRLGCASVSLRLLEMLVEEYDAFSLILFFR
uniref:Uncharacterized protein n=1 Tax=Arundo donax TaxID=35708 RepID=A0A0A9BPE7_ARUDO